MNIRIYVATHKKSQFPEEAIYLPLHVGSAGKSPLGYICDNTGMNISRKNESYCELTGIYWMWKNVTCDIIGLCHYRRYFVKDGRILTSEDIASTLRDYDLILGTSSMSQYPNNYLHYSAKHIQADLDTCGDVLAAKYPDYTDAFHLVMHTNLMNIGNMMICSKELFDRYCAWLFPLLDEVEQRTDISQYDTYQKRLYGFLAERLLRVFTVMQELRVKEFPIQNTEIGDTP
ncbi:MAG: DUF4422 domain-containing protein [Lachnospiraceae bacterium]|nr:DUF4422 domain-containing protein [Lachnospiraceae bacterium]